MALRLGCRNICAPICKKFLHIKHPTFYCQQLHNNPHHNNIATVDTLDDFTNQLLQKKIEKWDIIRSKKNLRLQPCDVEETNLNSAVDIKYLSINEINQLLKDAVDVYNCSSVMEIVNQCIKYNKYPSTELILQILSVRARCGDKEIVLELRKFVLLHDPDALKLHADFDHFLAVAMWIKGNVEESLNLLINIYRSHNILRRKIRLIFKYLVMDVTSSRSEATLVIIIKYFDDIYRDFGDFYPLSCIWQECFLSEWYSDQKVALDLLRTHNGLCKMITNRIPYIVGSVLKNHQVEIVYRLLEVLLEFDMKSDYARILQVLFDYKYWQRDLRSCSEIIQWSSEQNVLLSPTQYNNFISLLLHKKMDKSEHVHKKPFVPTVKLQF